MWLIAGLTLVAVGILAFISRGWRGLGQERDLGCVSHRWLAEHVG